MSDSPFSGVSSASPAANAELRPSMLRDYSPKTLACYEYRLVHYQHWCRLHGHQPAIDYITTGTVFEYVADQITRWNLPDETDTDDYPRYRPDTIRQAVNALIYWGERGTGDSLDDRAAKELLRRFADTFNRATPPAWRVPGRKSPRSRRPVVPRPSIAHEQGALVPIDT